MSELPNILFLMTDQHRHDAIGCADPVVKTPNLDALAARGSRYTQAACQEPMCVPSRYSMMTGLYGSQSELNHNTQIVPRDELLPLPVLAQRRWAAGYQTSIFGKWHLGKGREHCPTGFDEWAVLPDHGNYDGLGLPGTERGSTEWLSIADREPEWELFDLEKDPRDMHNVANAPAYAAIRRDLTAELHRLQAAYGDKPYEKDTL